MDKLDNESWFLIFGKDSDLAAYTTCCDKAMNLCSTLAVSQIRKELQ
jgi:hypothetical protein